MKNAMRLALGVVAAASTASLAASDATDHKLTAPQEVQWSAGPASLPPGAQASVLYGDPAKEGLFALRLKFPKGYRIAPHTHPKPELVTVISGTFKLGMGETADIAKAQAMPAGSFIALSPGTVHYAGADEETIVQLNSTGPWSVVYVNAKDDPRQKPK
jgi:quercetin dioxygenase-like cupin family protein